MATTNVNNLDALDPVANIGAGGETIIKAAVRHVIKQIAHNEPRCIDLFIGQMAAEGFAVSQGLTYTVQSPTFKVEVLSEVGGQKLVRAYNYIGSAWVKCFQGPLYVQQVAGGF